MPLVEGSILHHVDPGSLGLPLLPLSQVNRAVSFVYLSEAIGESILLSIPKNTASS